MAIQILPRTPGFGEMLATGLSSGLGQGLQSLMQVQLKQLMQQQQAGSLLPLFRHPGVSEETAKAQAKAAAMYPQLGVQLLKQKRDEELFGISKEKGAVTSPLMEGYTPEEQEKIRIAGLIGGRQEAIKTMRDFEKTKQKKQNIIRQQAERKNRPQFNQLVKDVSIGEKALPILKDMINLTDQLPTGLMKSAGKFLGNEAINAYNTLAEQLAAITGIKPKGLPSIDLPPAKLKEALGNMIKQYEDILLKKDIAEDIVTENDNYIPSNLFQEIDKRFKLRKHQLKKSTVKSFEPEETFPHLESEGKIDITPDTPQEYQQEIASNAPLGLNALSQSDIERQKYGAAIPEIPFGTTELQARTPSIMERIEEMAGMPLVSGPVSRTIAEGLSGLAGGPGNILSLLGSLGSYITGGALPTYEEAQEKLPISLPTTEQIRGKVFGPTLEGPEKTRTERIAGNIAREAAELVGPGMGAGVLTKVIGKLAKVPKWLKTAESFLKIAPKSAAVISTTGNAAEETLKEIGASESTQKMGKLITSLGTAALTNRMAISQANNLGKKIATSIKEGKPYTSYKLRDNLHTLYSALTKGEKTPLKNQLITAIEDIKSIKMSPEKLWDIRQLLDKAKDAKGLSPLTKESIPKLMKQIENGLVYSNKSLRPLITDYAGLSAAKDTSSALYSKLGQMTKRNPLMRAIMYSLGIYSAPRIFSKIGLAGLGGIGLLGEAEKSIRLLKNPVFYKKYGDLVKAGFASAAQQVAKAD